MKLLDVWINCPDQQCAETISSQLLERRLVACSNIYPPVKSAYHWQGKIESEQEIPLLLKTRDSLFEELCKLVKELHPYEVPSIIGIPIEFVNDDYRRWLEKETEAAQLRK